MSEVKSLEDELFDIYEKDNTIIRSLKEIYEKGRADVLKELREKELKHIHDILPPVPNCKLFDVEKLTEQLKEKKND